MRRSKTFSKVFLAPDDSEFHVSNKYESQDYDRLDSEIMVKEELIAGRFFNLKMSILRVFLYILIGIFTGLIGTILEIGCYYGAYIRYSFLYDESYKYMDRVFLKMVFLWIFSVFTPAFVAGVLVAYGEPLARGGGTHLVFGYLNGVNVKNFMKYKIVVIKIISMLLSVTSGIPCGKEGPMVHIGATLGCLVPRMSYKNFQPFHYFNQDPERRDMSAAGAAAGFTAAFGTPIAGIMIAFEETLTFWSSDLTFLIFITSFTSYFTLKFLVNTLIHDCIECVASKENLFLETMKDTDKSYFIFEVPLFIIFGVIGGILGGIYNWLRDKIVNIKNRYVDTPAKQLIELSVLVILHGLVQISLIKYLKSHCIKLARPVTESRQTPSKIKFDCQGDNEISVTGLFFYQVTGGVFRSLFTEKEMPIGIKPLFMFCTYYYFGTWILSGVLMAHGIFVPHIVVGNVWGRMIAEWLQSVQPSWSSWARPNKFSFLCGAAQLTGTLRISFTICIMMLEACNNVKLAVPIFVIVFTARFVGNLINIPMCTRLCYTLGIPLLEREPPPLLSHIKVKDILPTKPVVSLPLTASFSHLNNILQKCRHNGFPVLESEDNGRLQGLILRYQIVCLLKHYEEFTLEKITTNKMIRLLRQERDALIPHDDLEIEREEESNMIDLSPYMNRTPYIVHMDHSLPHAYRMFSSLGLRHLIVVNNNFDVVGIITRKDLSIFRFIRQGLQLDVRILPRKDK